MEKGEKKNSKNDFNLLSSKQHPIFTSPRTSGQKAADSLTKWVGS